jgi:hypothetical protein
MMRTTSAASFPPLAAPLLDHGDASTGHPIQLSIIAGASLQVIMENYTHLTKDDAYDVMLQAIAGGRRR